MRLHTLELTGFGPFRETQRVDFDAFGDDGVFLISGRTGAGKSSILDGVSFALYGSVPRYEGGEKRLRSDHSYLTDPTEVRLEFTVGQTRWRVTRAPEYDRPAKRGGGLTTEPPRAELDEQVEGVWIGRAAKPRDVGLALGEVLGLSAQQFQQVILLAQNKFSRFLLAPGDERQTLLRTLFGSRRFEQYRDDLDARRRDAQKKLDAAGEHARTLLELAERLVDEHDLAGEGEASAELAARRAAIVAAGSRADYRVEQAATARDQADAAHAAALAVHAEFGERARRARERDDARQRLAQLDERGPEIAADRARLESARAAEALRAPLETMARAATEAARADALEESALAAWAAGGGEASVDIAALIDERTADLARWEDAAAQERDLAALRIRLDAQARSLAEFDALIGALDSQLALVPARRVDLDARIAGARTGAARADDAQRRRTELTAQLAAAHEADRLAEAAAAAERDHLAASEAASAAAAAVTTLLQRRLAGFAGELAGALVEGEACAVCGSVEHPHPAAPATDPVTDEDLAAAEKIRGGAHTSAVASADAARIAREVLADARGRARGADAAETASALERAVVAADEADAAVRELDLLLAERSGFDELAAGAETERATLVERRASEREAHAAAVSEATKAAAVVAAARGEFPTVAERIAQGEAERVRARALAAARASAAELARALEVARADSDARLAASDFATADDARRALLTPEVTAALDARLADHAADLAATRERLLELELALTGADLTGDELAAASAAVAAADAARSAAIADERDAHNVAARLRELSRASHDAYADVAEVADDAASVTRLADTVAGRAPNTMKMDLETFVLAAELEEIVAAANLRLSEMSSGRYTLHHSDARAARGRASGLGIDVLDAHTGRLRTPQSLSGGETFLASLALALGLGEVVTARAGGIRLDTLFVDEGFGSLDPETLDLAMRTLDELRAGGRTVGVISHVEAMKEQLPAQLVVEATPEGPSIIRQESATPAHGS